MSADHFALADSSASCRRCHAMIPAYGMSRLEGDKERCRDNNGDLCVTCCSDCKEEASGAWRGAGLHDGDRVEDELTPSFAATQATAFGMMCRAAIETSATYTRLGYPESAELSRLKAQGFAEVAWRYGRETLEVNS